MNQIVVVGHKGVGKSSLISHYIKRPVLEKAPEDAATNTVWNHNCTMVKCNCVTNTFENEATHFRLLDFVDTSHLEQVPALIENHLEIADAFVMMLDVSRMEETIQVVRQFCEHLIDKLLPKSESNHKPDVIVFANKVDLVGNIDQLRRHMTKVKDLCKDFNNIPYMQISVKTGENVNNSLDQIANMVEKSTCRDF